MNVLLISSSWLEKSLVVVAVLCCVGISRSERRCIALCLIMLIIDRYRVESVTAARLFDASGTQSPRPFCVKGANKNSADHHGSNSVNLEKPNPIELLRFISRYINIITLEEVGRVPSPTKPIFSHSALGVPQGSQVGPPFLTKKSHNTVTHQAYHLSKINRFLSKIYYFHAPDLYYGRTFQMMADGCESMARATTDGLCRDVISQSAEEKGPTPACIGYKRSTGSTAEG